MLACSVDCGLKNKGPFCSFKNVTLAMARSEFKTAGGAMTEATTAKIRFELSSNSNGNSGLFLALIP